MNVMSLLTVLGAPLVAALILVALRGRAARSAGWIAGLAAALSLASTFLLLPALQQGDVPEMGVNWIPAAGIRLKLHLDWLTWPFLVTEAAVTLVAVVYSWGYHHADEHTPYFYALLMFFAVGMSGTTLADGMFLFYIFWELMLVASCALIAVWGDGERRGAIALKYFIFTHVGSLMVLVGLLLLYDATGSDSFSALRAGVPRRFQRQDGGVSAAPLAARRAYRGPDVGDDHACRGDAQHGYLWHLALPNEHLFPGSNGSVCRAHDGRRRRL
jgi:formate hydrogenlyase subunit 3/multisubunit Na+/H+ antiporter MnhD subunit